MILHMYNIYSMWRDGGAVFVPPLSKTVGVKNILYEYYIQPFTIMHCTCSIANTLYDYNI